MNGLRLVVPLAAALMFVPGGAGAAEANKKERVPEQPAARQLPVWIVNCSNANVDAVLKCSMRQTLTMAKTGQNITGVSFARDAARKDVLDAIVQLPHGVSFEAGLTFWVDEGKKHQVKINYADAQGSYAAFSIGKDIIDALKAGKLLRLLVQAMSGDKTIFELRLDGFGNSLKYL